MQVEILEIEGCPHRAAAVDLVHDLLDELQLKTAVHLTTVRTLTEAEQRGFVGSPAILINGIDPFATPEQEPALACRVYRSESGSLPDRYELRRALREVAGREVPT